MRKDGISPKRDILSRSIGSDGLDKLFRDSGDDGTINPKFTTHQAIAVLPGNGEFTSWSRISRSIPLLVGEITAGGDPTGSGTVSDAPSLPPAQSETAVCPTPSIRAASMMNCSWPFVSSSSITPESRSNLTMPASASFGRCV